MTSNQSNAIIAGIMIVGMLLAIVIYFQREQLREERRGKCKPYSEHTVEQKLEYAYGNCQKYS